MSRAGVVLVTSSSAVASGVSSSSRLYFLDWIRVLALLVVFVLHGLTGIAGHPSFLESTPAGVGLIAPVGIGMFFLVSGAGSLFSLNKRSSKQYLKERVLRIALPFVVGGMTLVPLTFLLSPTNRESTTGSIVRTWWNDDKWTFSEGRSIAPFVVFGYWLWVLAFLFCFSVIALPFLQWLRSDRSDPLIAFSTRLAAVRGGLLLWILPVALLAAAVEFVFIQLGFQPDDEALYDAFFYAGWGSFARYLGFFVLGAILVRNRGVLRSVQRDWPIALAVFGLLVLLLAAVEIDWWFDPGLPNALAAQAWLCAAFWSAAMVVVAVGQRFWNQPSKLLAYSSGIILAFYVFHAPALTATSWIFIGPGDDVVGITPGDFTARVFYDLYTFSRGWFGAVLTLSSFVLLIGFIEWLRLLLGATTQRFPGYPSRAVVAGADPAVVGSRDGDTLGARSDGGGVAHGASVGD